MSRLKEEYGTLKALIGLAACFGMAVTDFRKSGLELDEYLAAKVQAVSSVITEPAVAAIRQGPVPGK